jgi:hypothetical protein
LRLVKFATVRVTTRPGLHLGNICFRELAHGFRGCAEDQGIVGKGLSFRYTAPAPTRQLRPITAPFKTTA